MQKVTAWKGQTGYNNGQMMRNIFKKGGEKKGKCCNATTAKLNLAHFGDVTRREILIVTLAVSLVYKVCTIKLEERSDQLWQNRSPLEKARRIQENRPLHRAHLPTKG